jgi:hypothetical protein
MTNAAECIRCHSQMESGWVPDNTRAGLQQQSWSPGEPQTSAWTVLKAAEGRVLPVTTLRCPKCGYLESYATPQSQDGVVPSRRISSLRWSLAAIGLALLLLALGIVLLTRAR